MRAIELAPDAWLVFTDRPIALAAAVDRSGLDDVVPGADCVLLRGPRAAAVAADLPTDPAPLPPPPPVVLPGRFDGEDLEAVAAAAGMTPDSVVAAVRKTTFTVAFCGFSPGFAYMTGLPAQLHLPRRERPRTRVPRGAIALASGYCAIYPTQSPGGWHLIGHCEVDLFDTSRTDPALLVPGATVRFE